MRESSLESEIKMDSTIYSAFEKKYSNPDSLLYSRKFNAPHKNAALINDPSKWLTYSMYRTAKWALDRSPFKILGVKYKIPHEDADKEANDLTILRFFAQENQK